MTERADEELVSLYIHLYFDEDVSADIVGNLRTRGFDVVSARDMEMLQKDDDEQMLYAASQQRAVVTHNRADFEDQHRKFLDTGMKHYGIIIAKRRRKDTEVVAKLLALLDSVTAEEMENQLRYI
ncbi:MAG: DUF5615 family PIN-like protein [Chloroflexi bacterium]|nr:DUF5615 family PIN-like protein [Chloroflexota bacterium]MBI3764641.1 DUF5615 family PIN-like protein [Chloroflexota bacterium]